MNDGQTRLMRRLVLLLFFLSGACGLVYQVVWARMLTHVFGTTAIAVGTVLAAFMLGLSAGSWLLGKTADRGHNPLRLYAYLEFGIGVAGLLVHFLLDRITPLYVFTYSMLGEFESSLVVARFLLAFGLVMVPTILMGGTLPVLARFVMTRMSVVGKSLSTLYALNTAGAVAGTLATGFYLIGAFGVNWAVYFAVITNVGIGLIAWVASYWAAVPSSDIPGSRRQFPTDTRNVPSYHPRLYELLLIGFAISGLTSFAYEIYWTRSLVFLLGNSTYALTTMLTAFLTGIALGGYLVRFVVDRVPDRMALFAWIQILIGVFSVAALPLLFTIADPGRIREFLIENVEHVALLITARFIVALLIMLLPATLIGATFPLVGRIGVQDLEQAGSSIGRIYAVNTFGNVIGALLPGLLLWHWLGIRQGILAMATLNVCVGITILLTRPVRFIHWHWAMLAILVGTALTFGQAPLNFQFPSRTQSSADRVLFYEEGPSATTKVFIDPETREKSMSLDGVTIGGNGVIDYKQKLLAHLPKLLADNVSLELSVGLGSGILVGESARHDRVREIVCVEIEPSVVAGAALFAEENNRVLRDPRLRVVVDDVLNYLRIRPGSFNVISADEKTQEDYASNGLSYSKEYYELLRRRLAPNGIVIQWVPTSLPTSQYAMVLKTFAGVFPHVTLWYFPPALRDGPANTILVGSNDRITPDLARMRKILTSTPEKFEGLAPYGLTTAESVLAHFVADERTLRGAVTHAPENTLDHPRYEFFSLSDYALPAERRLLLNFDFLMDLRRAALPTFLSELTSGVVDMSKIKEAVTAEELFSGAYRQLISGVTGRGVSLRLEHALRAAPWNDSLRSRIFLHYWSSARKLYNLRDYRLAATFMDRALSVYGKSALARAEYGIILTKLGATERALEETRLAVSLDPKLVLARRVLADLLIAAGLRHEAAEQLRGLLEIEPGDASARKMLSRL